MDAEEEEAVKEDRATYLYLRDINIFLFVFFCPRGIYCAFR